MKGCFGPSHMGSGLADRRASKSEVSHTTDRREHARTAATFRRPTKAFQDGLAANPANVYLLTLDDVIASEGGIPIIADGKLVGAMGCSGGTGAQDGQVCQAAIAALK